MNSNISRSGSFPVAGLGASAGGLAAFEAFFSSIPPDRMTGLAFVTLQHMSSAHKSVLAALLGGFTHMPVHEVADGIRLMPDCVYVAPPGKDIEFRDGALHLLDFTGPEGLHLPIDFFFRSLARGLHEKAIGIVLSGTGRDGTEGIRAIKAEGGLVIVQKTASCEFDGMPASALSTGAVDFDLMPAEMPERIVAYSAYGFKLRTGSDSSTKLKAETSLIRIFNLIRARTGHDFSQYKPNTIHRRIERRMAVQRIETFDDYVKFIHQNSAEVQALFRDFLIGVTNFFRDPEAFSVLEKEVIPALFYDKPAGSLIRVWVPGCSTGEEAYSLAILLAEYRDALKRDFTIQIFAADIDSNSISIARAGIYPADIAAEITPERLARFFTAEPRTVDKGPPSWRINKNIRDMLIFSEQDLIKDPPFSRMDLISCRNLLIYMGSELQKKIIPLFHYALIPGGYLFLGTSETVGDFNDLFSALDRKQKIFRRSDHAHSPAHAYPASLFPPLAATQTPMTNIKHISEKPSLREITQNAILDQLAPAAALVDGHGDILYLHGRTGLFLEPAPGETGVNNIRKMAREGLQRDITMALHRAAYQSPVVCPGIRVKGNSGDIIVNLTVRAVAARDPGTHGDRLYLVMMEQAMAEPLFSSAGDAARQPAAFAGTLPSSPDPDSRIAALLKELQDKEEYLQTTNEELETSNEELKASYEEMQSVNEELQSTNEELETSKEELQSINEELATVNSELQVKVSDLSRSENDMNNLLAGTGIATVFVDHELRIVRFTPAAVRIMNLIPTDIGRPIGHITSNLKDYAALLSDTRGVLDSLIPREIEVNTVSGDRLLLRILPYRTLSNVIEGAVLTFIDNSLSRKKPGPPVSNAGEAG